MIAICTGFSIREENIINFPNPTLFTSNFRDRNHASSLTSDLSDISHARQNTRFKKSINKDNDMFVGATSKDISNSCIR